MEHTTIAVDLAKSVFQVAVSHKAGRVDSERRLSRDRFLEYMVQQPPATVLLEACGSSHYWARRLEGCGHTVRLLPMTCTGIFGGTKLIARTRRRSWKRVAMTRSTRCR